MSVNWSDLERPPLRQEQLRRALVVPDGIWRDIRVVEHTVSTNADLAARARTGGAAGEVLIAELQTGGRGRLDRSWTAPPRAGLTFSALLRPDIPATHWSWLPLLAAVAVAQPLARLSQLDVRVKWPNDIVVDDLKVGGILAERADDALVIGVGLNVLQRADELPVPTATSLVLAGSQVIDRDPVLRAVLRSLARALEDFALVGGDADAAGLRSAYLAMCTTVGCAVRVELPGGAIVEGTALDVDADGRLVVQTSDASVEVVGAGDVVHVR